VELLFRQSSEEYLHSSAFKVEYFNEDTEVIYFKQKTLFLFQIEF